MSRKTDGYRWRGWREPLSSPDLFVDGVRSVLVNAFFSVQEIGVPSSWGELSMIGIRARSRGDTVSWRDKQEIKNVLFGRERTAIEVFPPSSELLDLADVYWLYVLPPDRHLPFFLSSPRESDLDISVIGRDKPC